MDKKSQYREASTDRMLGAGNEQEVEAEKDAEGRLKENDAAVRVIAASERLDKTDGLRSVEKTGSRCSYSRSYVRPWRRGADRLAVDRACLRVAPRLLH